MQNIIESPSTHVTGPRRSEHLFVQNLSANIQIQHRPDSAPQTALDKCARRGRVESRGWIKDQNRLNLLKADFSVILWCPPVPAVLFRHSQSFPMKRSTGKSSSTRCHLALLNNFSRNKYRKDETFFYERWPFLMTPQFFPIELIIVGASGVEVCLWISRLLITRLGYLG